MLIKDQSGLCISLTDKPGIDKAFNPNHCGSKHLLPGNPAGLENIWTLYSEQDGSLTDVPDSQVQYTVSWSDDAIIWHAQINRHDDSISADVTMRLNNNKLTITLDNARDCESARIILLRLNGICGVVSSDETSRLALPAHGGRLIDPASTLDGQTDHRYNWILDSFGSCAVAYTQTLSIVARIHSMDDQLTSLVCDTVSDPYNSDACGRCAQLGAILRLRYTDADPSYRRAKPDRNLKLTEDLEVLPIERCFIVQTSAIATLEYITHESVRPDNGWVIGARRIWENLPVKPSHYYENRMVYKIFAQAPNQDVQTNYQQMWHIISDVHARTGGAQQVAYIVGFQHKGHDSGYPDVFTLNTAPGSFFELSELTERCQSIGARVSFHDNFDDAYANSPSWDPSDISRDNNSHLLRGGIWNDEQAYWISMPHYAANKSVKRIERTLKEYPFIKDTYHLDVLTASVFRTDFRGGSPSGKQSDLKARLEIIGQFQERGIDVSSEACGLPFIGGITYFWHMQRMPFPLYSGDKRIPMVPFLAHGKADYAGTHTDEPRMILDGLLYGGFYCDDVTAATPIKTLTDAYFMLQAPLNQLRDEQAIGYDETPDGWKRITYSSGSTIAVQFEECACRVDIKGQRWIENGTAMIPRSDGSVMFYRAWEEPYSHIKYRICNNVETRVTLYPVGVDASPITMDVDYDNCISIDTPVGVAYQLN